LKLKYEELLSFFAFKFNLRRYNTGSKVAGCVIDLQRRCPDARVVYCSATGISEIGNMAYMAGSVSRRSRRARLEF